MCVCVSVCDFLCACFCNCFATVCTFVCIGLFVSLDEILCACLCMRTIRKSVCMGNCFYLWASVRMNSLRVSVQAQLFACLFARALFCVLLCAWICLIVSTGVAPLFARVHVHNLSALVNCVSACQHRCRQPVLWQRRCWLPCLIASVHTWFEPRSDGGGASYQFLGPDLAPPSRQSAIGAPLVFIGWLTSPHGNAERRTRPQQGTRGRRIIPFA